LAETTNITIYIDDRPYSLKVNVSEEAMIRQVVDEVNTKLKHFQQAYKSRDKKDLLSMTLLTYAVEMAKFNNTQTPAAIDKRLDALNDLLDNALNK
jgi:cell division protein ZapA (FtsZ GTPase activity inhibitor)